MKILRASLFLLAVLTAWPLMRADDGGLPSGAFDASRYSLLWETSPFAVASPVAVESVQYSLVGAAEFEGVSYASIIDKQSQNHFVVTSKTPSHGLSMVSLTHGSSPGSVSATLQSSGGILKLALDTTTAPLVAPQPVNTAPTMPMPGMSPGVNPNMLPLFRRRPHAAQIFTPPIVVPQPPPSPNTP